MNLRKARGIDLRAQTVHCMNRHPLAEDYAVAGGRVRDRFDCLSPYVSSEGWEERARWLDSRGRMAADRDHMADALLHYNRKHNGVPEALAAAERLRDPRALAVVGGQQAGLFAGPLLVVYKAITVLNAAREAERRLGRPVVPIFWIAGEDHDWEEANHLFVLTPQLAVKRVAVTGGPIAADGGRPVVAGRTAVSRTPVAPEAWELAWNELRAALPDTEFKAAMMTELRSVAESSATLSEAFAKTLSLLFGKRGLVLIDSDDAGLRAVESPMFAELVRRHRELSAALAEGDRAAAAAGYPLQAESAPDSLNVFCFHEGERKLLFCDRETGEIRDRKASLRLTVDELEQLAVRHPASLSNNALTRPLMQEYLFPTVAAVLGPSETAYWGSLKESFHAFGMKMPIIVPRQEFTLIEGTVQKQLDKFGLSFEDAWERLDARRDAWLAEQDELGVSGRFDRAKAEFERMYRPLLEAVATMNPGLRKLGEANLGKIVEQIEFMQHKSLEAMKLQHEAGLRQWERIRLAVRPMNKPQERVYTVFQYWNRYGRNWLDELAGMAGPDFNAAYKPHAVVYM